MLLKLENNRLEITIGDDASHDVMNLANDVHALEADVLNVDIVVLNFPTFKDGRAYTQARQLRERAGFTGDLRATGDIIRDQILYMVRCGFTSFEVAPETDVGGLNAALAEFSDFYQPAADVAVPVWMRRQRAGREQLRRFA
ncbi:MAG: DUF934 domain-containing protein [Aquisalinus sp.]|nr:DUF934 domain-containing protein [Aquisalinus sp.]